MFEVRIKVVEVVGDSKLVVQQINMESQCLDGALNCYCKECLDIASGLDKLCIKHISREENIRGNTLAQQVSHYEVKEGNFIVKRRPT
jgi:ribonuclease HI